MRIDIDGGDNVGNGNGNGNANADANADGHENDQIIPIQTDQSNDMNAVLSSSEHASLWPQPGPDLWSLPLTAPGLNASFPSDLGMMNAAGFTQWTGDPNEQGRGAGITSAATPDFIPFSLPASNLGLSDLSRASPQNMDQGVSTATSLSSQSPISSKLSPQDHLPDLRSYLNQESLGAGRRVQIYFAEFHPSWPILHAPTFDIENVSQPLLASMVMLASWLEGRQDHMNLAPLVFDAVTATLMVRNCLPCGLIAID